MSKHKGARAVCFYILGVPAYVCVGALFVCARMLN